MCVCDSQGLISRDRPGLTGVKAELATRTNPRGLQGPIDVGLEDADVFIGVSAGKVAESAVAGMADDAIIFALANPHPEVDPAVAGKYAAVVATGRSDYPNQINNVLAFPGVFRGALDVRASRITTGMQMAAADALSDLVGDEVGPEYIVPSAFDKRVAGAVAEAVAAAARAEGVARV